MVGALKLPEINDLNNLYKREDRRGPIRCINLRKGPAPKITKVLIIYPLFEVANLMISFRPICHRSKPHQTWQREVEKDLQSPTHSKRDEKMEK